MITHIIVWIEIEHIMYLLLFGYPSIIILIMFEERTVTIWNICLVPKQRRNGAFLNGGCRYFVKKTEYPAFQKLVICGLIPKDSEKPVDARRKEFRHE